MREGFLTSHMQIDEERSKLPIAGFRDAITSAVESHQVAFCLLRICF